MAAALGLDNNIAGFNVAPGMIGNAPGLIGTTKFREGGAVGYGQSMSGGGGIMSVLEPFGNYLTEQIDTQRVDPFLETVSNAAYQEFGIKPSQGGGGGFFSGDFYKDNLGGDFSGMPPPLPAVQQPVMNMDTELQGSVASLSNFGPDVGNGGLFGGGPPSPNVNDGRYVPDLDGRYLEVYPLGGGPMSGGTPTQLPGPRIPTFVDPPRKTSGGNMTPGGPEIDLMGNIAQPTLGGNVGGDFMGSAQNYFGNNIDPRGPVTPMTPEDIFRQAQMRNIQQDVKSPEVQAYLDNIIQTGGRPTMMAPKIDYSNLMSVLPGGGLITGQPGAGFGMPNGNGPGGVTLRPTPGAMPVEAFMGGSSTFDESAPYPISMQLARRQFG